MAVIPSDIKYYKSLISTSLGGGISATELSGTVNDLFDAVTGNEAETGDTEYRCVYIKNTNGVSSLLNPKVFISSNTPSTFTLVKIGLGLSGVDGEELSISDENIAPVGVVFSAASGYPNGLAFPTLLPGQHIGLWIERIVDLNARAYNSDSVVISTLGFTS